MKMTPHDSFTVVHVDITLGLFWKLPIDLHSTLQISYGFSLFMVEKTFSLYDMGMVGDILSGYQIPTRSYNFNPTYTMSRVQTVDRPNRLRVKFTCRAIFLISRLFRMTPSSYSVTEKVIRQLEYYFGNANLSRDTFLMGEMAKDNGWVSIDTMLRVSNL